MTPELWFTIIAVLQLGDIYTTLRALKLGSGHLPATSGNGHEEVQAGLSPEVAGRVIGIGAECDQVVLSLEACQAYVGSIRNEKPLNRGGLLNLKGGAMKLDKLLHFLVGALIAAYVLPEGWLITMTCVTLVAWGVGGIWYINK